MQTFRKCFNNRKRYGSSGSVSFRIHYGSTDGVGHLIDQNQLAQRETSSSHGVIYPLNARKIETFTFCCESYRNEIPTRWSGK